MALAGLLGIFGALGVAGSPQESRLEGRVTDGLHPLAGVQVYPDRLVRVRPTLLPPTALTDGEGRFQLALAPTDEVLVVEKPGWRRDLIPRSRWNQDLVLRPAHLQEESVVVVRLDLPGHPPTRSEAELRSLLFDRRPGVASVANYVYEVSKGGLSLMDGRWLTLKVTSPLPKEADAGRSALVREVLAHLKGQPLGSLDRVDNLTGRPFPDGKPDHLWIIGPGAPGSVTQDPAHFSPISLLMPLPWDRSVQWSTLFFSEETPLGNLVHEAFHAMGEHGVDDFYVADTRRTTAGGWDLMDAGMYRGWDRQHPEAGPWQEDTGYSPAQPMGWTRGELWYAGRFADTVPTLTLKGKTWEGWMDPLARAPGTKPQRIKVADPRETRRFWEFNVRWAWGFDRGRCGGRFGPGYQGVVVALIDPTKLTRGEPRGPVRVIDAHPGTTEPAKPRFPGGRWQLEDAAFGLGPGDVSVGQDGPLRWQVLEVDAEGCVKLRIELRRPR